MILSFLRSCCLIRNSQVRNFSGFETYLTIGIGLADNHSSMTILRSNGRSPWAYPESRRPCALAVRGARQRRCCAQEGSESATARSQISLLRRAGRGLEVNLKELRRHRAPHLRICPRKYTRVLARRRRSMHTRARTDERANGDGVAWCLPTSAHSTLARYLESCRSIQLASYSFGPTRCSCTQYSAARTRCMHRAANHATAARSADGADGGQRAAVHSRLWPRGTAEADARGR